MLPKCLFLSFKLLGFFFANAGGQAYYCDAAAFLAFQFGIASDRRSEAIRILFLHENVRDAEGPTVSAWQARRVREIILILVHPLQWITLTDASAALEALLGVSGHWVLVFFSPNMKARTELGRFHGRFQLVTGGHFKRTGVTDEVYPGKSGEVSYAQARTKVWLYSN
jgi:hypothetical protein